MYGDYYNADGIVNHENEELILSSINKELPFSQVQSFIIPLAVLKQMQKKDHALSAKYDQVISAAKVPTPTPKHYCLFLRFMDE